MSPLLGRSQQVRNFLSDGGSLPSSSEGIGVGVGWEQALGMAQWRHLAETWQEWISMPAHTRAHTGTGQRMGGTSRPQESL